MKSWPRFYSHGVLSWNNTTVAWTFYNFHKPHMKVFVSSVFNQAQRISDSQHTPSIAIKSHCALYVEQYAVPRYKTRK